MYFFQSSEEAIVNNVMRLLTDYIRKIGILQVKLKERTSGNDGISWSSAHCTFVRSR